MHQWFDSSFRPSSSVVQHRHALLWSPSSLRFQVSTVSYMSSSSYSRGRGLPGRGHDTYADIRLVIEALIAGTKEARVSSNDITLAVEKLRRMLKQAAGLVPCHADLFARIQQLLEAAFGNKGSAYPQVLPMPTGAGLASSAAWAAFFADLVAKKPDTGLSTILGAFEQLIKLLQCGQSLIAQAAECLWPGQASRYTSNPDPEFAIHYQDIQFGSGGMGEQNPAHSKICQQISSLNDYYQAHARNEEWLCSTFDTYARAVQQEGQVLVDQEHFDVEQRALLADILQTMAEAKAGQLLSYVLARCGEYEIYPWLQALMKFINNKWAERNPDTSLPEYGFLAPWLAPINRCKYISSPEYAVVKAAEQGCSLFDGATAQQAELEEMRTMVEELNSSWLAKKAACGDPWVKGVLCTLGML